MLTNSRHILQTDFELFFHAQPSTLTDLDNNPLKNGWYCWRESATTMADKEPIGPFVTEYDAVIAARRM